MAAVYCTELFLIDMLEGQDKSTTKYILKMTIQLNPHFSKTWVVSVHSYQYQPSNTHIGQSLV